MMEIIATKLSPVNLLAVTDFNAAVCAIVNDIKKKAVHVSLIYSKILGLR